MKREYELLQARVEQLGELIYKDGGSMRVASDSAESIVPALIANKYTVTLRECSDGDTVYIEYWKEEA